MNRRKFSWMMAGAAVSAILHSRLPAQQPSGQNSGATEGIAGLYEHALVLDCNSGLAWEDGSLPLPQADLDMVRNCGVNVIKWSIGGLNTDFPGAVAEVARIQRMIEAHPAYFAQVRVPADLQRAKHEKKLGIIFSFESVEMLEGKVPRIELFRNLGVRAMQLSYNGKSPFAAGVMAPDGGGLTLLGQHAVVMMNSLGVAIDLSHANAQTTADAITASSKPIIMSHAGCAAVHPHPRNKTDDQLRSLAHKGGVVGIYDMPYLAASPKQPTVEDYMAHMEHALKVAGEDHVGIGSDVSIQPVDTSPQRLAEFKEIQEERQKAGLAAPEEDRPLYVAGLNILRKGEVIADQLLKRGYPGRVAEKILGSNFARVFDEIWA